MKIKQIIYLTQTPFSVRDNSRFGIDVFLNHGINVKVLDITSYMDIDVAKNYISANATTFRYVKKLDTYFKIKEVILNAASETVFISFIGESSIKSLKILNLLSKHKKEFGIILSGSLPVTASKRNFSSRFKLLSLKNIKRLIGKALYMLLFNGYKYSFVISSGEESYKVINKKYKDSDIIEGHAFDYDLYLGNKDNDTTNKDYAVFLDEFFPFHPDYIIHGIDYSSYANEYYEKLSTFFDYIEKVFSLEVIICAHPRSYYDKLPNYWNTRKYIIGNTINLVKNSKFCLLHASTSINFVVLYNKPAIFITMNEIKKSNIQIIIESMAHELNSKIIDLDTFALNEEFDIKYNKDNYDSYKKKYIKKLDTPELNNWELLYCYYIYK